MLTEQNSQVSAKIKQFHQEIRKKHHQTYFNKTRNHYRQKQKNNHDNFPLVSQMLQKYHLVPHNEMHHYLKQIQQQIINNNVYLSVFMQQKMVQDDKIMDEQSLFIQDLMYLTLEFNQFRFPRKFKFCHNQSPETASYISLVCNQISPQQLSYWINYMSEQDKDSMYLTESISQDRLYYQKWINHPVLRQNLLIDFKYIKNAAILLRDIIVYSLSLSKLKNSQGFHLTQILCKFLHQQLQSMNSLNSVERKFQIFGEHMQICAKIVIKNYQSNNSQQQNKIISELQILLNKALIRKVQSVPNLITPLFCLWIIDALVIRNIRILSNENYLILLQMIHYDLNAYSKSQYQYGNVVNESKIQIFEEFLLKQGIITVQMYKKFGVIQNNKQSSSDESFDDF